MGIIALVRADFLKQRHTSYWGIHTVIPIAGATPSKATLVIVAVKTIIRSVTMKFMGMEPRHIN